MPAVRRFTARVDAVSLVSARSSPSPGFPPAVPLASAVFSPAVLAPSAVPLAVFPASVELTPGPSELAQAAHKTANRRVPPVLDRVEFILVTGRYVIGIDFLERRARVSPFMHISERLGKSTSAESKAEWRVHSFELRLRRSVRLLFDALCTDDAATSYAFRPLRARCISASAPPRSRSEAFASWHSAARSSLFA